MAMALQLLVLACAALAACREVPVVDSELAEQPSVYATVITPDPSYQPLMCALWQPST